MIPEAALAVALYLSPIHKASLIPPAWQDFAECVSARESHHNYRAKNRSSSASGRWQFLDGGGGPGTWRQGLAWMVWQRLVDHGMAKAKAKRIRLHLQATPIAKWRPAFQDAGFVAVVTASPNGWRHWSLAGSPCNRKAPK